MVGQTMDMTMDMTIEMTVGMTIGMTLGMTVETPIQYRALCKGNAGADQHESPDPGMRACFARRTHVENRL